MSAEQGDVVGYGQPVGYGEAVGGGLAYEQPPNANNDLGNGGTAAAAGHSASASDESQLLLLATQTSVQHEPPQASPAGALTSAPLTFAPL